MRTRISDFGLRIAGWKYTMLLLPLLVIVSPLAGVAGSSDTDAWLTELNDIEAKVEAFVPDKDHPDDPFVVITLREAVAAIREGNGGIGACLVDERTGRIVERGHNRQYEPYFRSDLHAEMDLITRYEEKVRARRSRPAGKPTAEQRKIEGLVLYTSVEPCPMCLSRIINVGIGKVYWAAEDLTGGMGYKIADLPQFWRDRASGQLFQPARCSTELKQLASRLFRHSMKKNKAK